MVVRALRYIFRTNYRYHGNVGGIYIIEKKLIRNSHLAVACCQGMVKLSNPIVTKIRQTNQEAMVRTEFTSLELYQYSTEKRTTRKNFNDLVVRVTSTQENKATQVGNNNNMLIEYRKKWLNLGKRKKD